MVGSLAHMASKFARQMQRKEKRVLNVSNHRIATLDVPKMTQVTLELTHKTIASTRLQETTNVFLVHDAFTIRSLIRNTSSFAATW